MNKLVSKFRAGSKLKPRFSSTNCKACADHKFAGAARAKLVHASTRCLSDTEKDHFTISV